MLPLKRLGLSAHHNLGKSLPDKWFYYSSESTSHRSSNLQSTTEQLGRRASLGINRMAFINKHTFSVSAKKILD